MTAMKRTKALTGMTACMAMLLSFGVANLSMPSTAQAVPSMNEYHQAVADHADLKEQLAGVNADLADTILELDDLTENQIPAAVEAANEAQQTADQAQSLADATAQRLEAARQDRENLEEKIKQTGEDYDDAKDAVAQLARESFHGSAASDLMSVVTNSSTTDEFVGRMQSQAAVARSEANAASDAAGELGVSMNRKERLSAIEDEIAQLKTQADAQAAAASQAAADAQARQDELQALREQGEEAREKLEAQSDQLTTQEAKEAAEIVAMKSEIDSWAAQQQQMQAAKPNPNTGGQQQVGGNTGGGSTGGTSGGNTGGGSSGGSSGGGSSSGGSTSGGSSSGGSTSGGSSSGGSTGGSTGGASGMNYAVPGSCPAGSGFCYGHSTGNTVGGSAYPALQCTLWAYLRRSELGLPVGSYMGNGTQWADTARSLGYYVNNTPHYGAVMVIRAGQYYNGRYADPYYGHVAIVERVNADGSVLISEGGTGFPTFPYWETVPNAYNYEYIHY